MRSGHNSGKLSKLFTEPLTLWTSAASKLRDHEEKSKLHQWSVLPWKTMENKSLPVHQFAYKGLQNRICQNQEKLKPILKLLFCVDRRISPYEATGTTPNITPQGKVLANSRDC